MNERIMQKQISEFLSDSERRSVPMSINERSLEVFGNEKFLASSECKKILHKYGVSESIFNTYPTPEPFIYYLCDNESQDILIIENKDTWYTMRKILMETKSVCNHKFKALIYGEGRKIQSSFAYIESEDMKLLKPLGTIYYFGDIDSSGVDILCRLVEQYPGYHILPFISGYQFLYKNRHLGRTKDLQLSIKITYKELSILNFLGETAIDDLYYLCNHDYIIPQEIVNYSVLKKWNNIHQTK